MLRNSVPGDVMEVAALAFAWASVEYADTFHVYIGNP